MVLQHFPYLRTAFLAAQFKRSKLKSNCFLRYYLGGVGHKKRRHVFCGTQKLGALISIVDLKVRPPGRSLEGDTTRSSKARPLGRPREVEKIR
jgi:hypothetical protein